jgi:hypothetical protein
MGHLAACLGSAARLGAVLKAFATSNDDELFAAWHQFKDQTSFKKDEIVNLIDLLDAKNIMAPPDDFTAQEKAAIAVWPTAQMGGIYSVKKAT